RAAGVDISEGEGSISTIVHVFAFTRNEPSAGWPNVAVVSTSAVARKLVWGPFCSGGRTFGGFERDLQCGEFRWHLDCQGEAILESTGWSYGVTIRGAEQTNSFKSVTCRLQPD